MRGQLTTSCVRLTCVHDRQEPSNRWLRCGINQPLCATPNGATPLQEVDMSGLRSRRIAAVAHDRTDRDATDPVSVAATDRKPNRWAVLAVVGVAQLMVVLDSTIVTIAIPSAQKALGFSTDSRQWIVTAYALSFGSLLLLGGKLTDLFGRKWTLIAGLVGFSVASAIGGLAQSFGVLVTARAFQGAFGALLAPSALGLLTVTFEGSPDRNTAFGIFGAIAGGGASIGLLLGGVLTQA